MRDTSQLHPTLQLKLENLIDKCEEAGLKIKITECLRTVVEQDDLYAQGRTKPGNIVTNAKGSTYSSMHMWGVAADFCRNDGKGAYDNSDGFFDKVGKIGQSIGLEWGGAWKSIVDKPHFQLPYWGSTTTVLRETYGVPELFFATWKPTETEYGEELPEEKFRLIKASYLRSTPEVNKNKVAYGELSTTLKKKCTRKGEYALMKAGSVFIRIRSFKDKYGNKWMQMKSGYWVPAIFDGEKRIEKI